MSKLILKSHPQIVAAMATKLSAETPINDYSDGSVALTLLEVAATEDFQQYIQMLNIIRNYNLDTTEGADLDKRAAEYGLTRESAKSHSGLVSIIDSSIFKISTKIYAGLPGPTAGSTSIFVDNASGFPASGSIYIGRTTSNSEGPITYSTPPTNLVSYWEIQLDTALINDHGTDESIILAQAGNRVIPAGTEVEVPETDVSNSIKFEMNQSITILDGEDSFENILVTAIEAGGFKIPSNSIISFPNIPFFGATVTNPIPFVNGRDEETDQQLRDRIRDTVQSLSKGTPKSIEAGIKNLIDEETNSSITSIKVVPPVNLADGPTKVYIDNGRGLEPSLAPIGLEILISAATGGERFFQVQNFPVAKANLICQNYEPYPLFGTETLIFRVGTNEETFTFDSTDFEVPGRAFATEISEAINNRSTIFEARTMTDDTGRRVVVSSIARANEELQIDPASSAQTSMNFSELEVSTIKFYKNDKLLTKDGITAFLLSAAQPFNLAANVYTTSDGDITITPNSKIITKSIAGTDGFTQILSNGDYLKFSSDTDVFYKKVKTVISDTKLLLEDNYPSSGGGTGNIVVWNSIQLEVTSNGDIRETEIVSFGPNDFSNALQALSSEVLARVEQEMNLSSAELAVNNTKIKFISNLENSSKSKMQILGGGAAIALGFSSTSAITGTLSFTGNSVLVTGTGTAFLSEIEEGQWIRANADNEGSWTKVEAIESDTILYLSSGYRGEDRASVASSKINFSDLSIGRDKDFTFNTSNGQIELKSPLVAGDSLSVGSINTRAFVDSLSETFDFNSLGASSSLIVRVDGGFQGTVTTGDAAPTYDTFIDTSIIDYAPNLFNGFDIEWTSGQNAGQTSTISAYNSVTGQLTCSSGFTFPIAIGDKFVLSQIITFTHVSDFADPANAFASEVVTALNSRLLGSIAQEIDGTVRILTTNFDSGASIQIKGGTANSALGYSLAKVDSELPNVASLKTNNSDRFGNPAGIGFTLGPGQNLVSILDGDNLNRTFSIPLEVSGVVTTGGSGSFSASATGTKYSSASYFNDFWIYWITGSNAGSVQIVDTYSGVAGSFSVSDVFPTTIANPIAIGDTFSIVPRTAENVARILNDFNTTTVSVVATAEVTGISGDFLQISSKTAGSSGKVFITGGTANKLGIAIITIPSGAPSNDVTTNSKAGIAKGLFVRLTVDGAVTTGDNTLLYNTFVDTSMITSIPNYFTGMNIEFLSGNNLGHSTLISAYNNITGQITLTDEAANAIAIGDSFRISRNAYVVDVQGAVSPYTLSFNDQANSAIDVSGFTAARSGTIRDDNGLDFSNIQVEGVDGYKYFTGLIQKAQWTIDGLDRDSTNYPGIGAAGTQFEVLTPVLVKVKLTLDIVPEQGITLNSIIEEIKTAVLEYVSSRRVGQDVVLSEIVSAVQSVSGVYDIIITNHTSNIVIADGELATLSSENLLIG